MTRTAPLVAPSSSALWRGVYRVQCVPAEPAKPAKPTLAARGCGAVGCARTVRPIPDSIIGCLEDGVDHHHLRQGQKPAQRAVTAGSPRGSRGSLFASTPQQRTAPARPGVRDWPTPSRMERDEVVISGVGGHFPECDNLDQFREALFSGVDVITDNAERWKPGRVRRSATQCHANPWLSRYLVSTNFRVLGQAAWGCPAGRARCRASTASTPCSSACTES